MTKTVLLTQLLVLCITFHLGLSCRCREPDNQYEYCDENFSEIPVVAIKMLKMLKKAKSKYGGITMAAKVVHVYRQGTVVRARKGQRVLLQTSKDSAACGRAWAFEKGRQYIMKIPNDAEIVKGKPKISVSSCDFFVRRDVKTKPSPHKYFSNLRC